MTHIVGEVFRLAMTTAILSLSLVYPTAAQVYLPQVGGPGGGQFSAACPNDEFLEGVNLRTGDDVDAVQPICAPAIGPTNMPPGRQYLEFHGGDGGGELHSLVCPPSNPVVIAMDIGYEGRQTVIVNNVWICCGRVVNTPQPLPVYPGGIFDGIEGGGSGRAFSGTPWRETQQCPPGQVAGGIHGHSGKWVDAIGLICVTPPAWAPPPPPQRPTIKPHIAESARSEIEGAAAATQRRPPTSIHLDTASAGRSATAGRPDTAKADLARGPIIPLPPRPPICLEAEISRARLSPNAPDLVRQCRAAGGHLEPFVKQ